MASSQHNSSMEVKYQYRVKLPQTLSEILKSEIWMFNHIPAAIVRLATEPMKFAATAFILLRTGNATVDINLRKHHIQAPAFLKISANSYLHIREVSDDIDAATAVASHDFVDQLQILFRNKFWLHNVYENSVLSLASETAETFFKFYDDMFHLYEDSENPDRDAAILHFIASFFFANGYRFSSRLKLDSPDTTSKSLTEKFLSLAQKYFATQHQLAFYASQLSISPKHLSRSVKKFTGFSASQWIERYILLEAKVMLKSSNLNVSQISDQLNFTTPSAFGKFFRKNTGMSPLNFRKSNTDS